MTITEQSLEKMILLRLLKTWESGQGSIITPAMIEATRVIGLRDKLCGGPEIISLLDKVYTAEDTLVENHIKRDHSMDRLLTSKISFLKAQIMPLDTVYQLHDDNKNPCICSLEQLNKLGDLYQTDWAIGAGVDRADPLKKSSDGARSVVHHLREGTLQ